MGRYRHPRTTQEKRQNQNCEYCRTKRRSHNLPEFWYDEIEKYTDRCWKSYRKTQYKIKTLPKKKKNSSSFAKSMSEKDHWCLNHKCRYCWNRFNKYRCKGCEERELNRKEYEKKELKKLQAQAALELKERQRQWDKKCY